MTDDLRLAAAFRATFLASAAVLALVLALSLTHTAAPPLAPQPVADDYGWPI